MHHPVPGRRCPTVWAMICLAPLLTGGVILTGCGPGAGPKSATPPPPAAVDMPETSRLTDEMIAGANVKRRGNDIVVIDWRESSIDDVRGAIANVRDFRSLSELFVPGPAIDASAIESLAASKSLRRLRIIGPMEDDVALRLNELSALQAITLQDAGVTDAGVAGLADLRDLREISLMGCPVTDACLDVLAGLPKLEKLRLRGTQITGESFDAIAATSIVDLELAETPFTSAGMSAVARMAKLQRLNLWLTGVDDDGLASLNGKTNLTLLNLDNCAAITDASMPVLLSLANLELLHLGGTSISPESIPQLTKLQKLKTLFITRLGIDESTIEIVRVGMPQLERLEY